jgi:hypothetical protein
MIERQDVLIELISLNSFKPRKARRRRRNCSQSSKEFFKNFWINLRKATTTSATPLQSEKQKGRAIGKRMEPVFTATRFSPISS